LRLVEWRFVELKRKFQGRAQKHTWVETSGKGIVGEACKKHYGGGENALTL